MKYIIRESQITDKQAVNEAHSRSILQVNNKDYTQEQVEAWAAVAYDDDIWQNNIKKDFHILIEADNRVEGFCHARMHDDGAGEIMGLYLTPKVLGIGAGRAVFERAMQHLKKFNPVAIKITGTKTAKGFYEHMGFVTIGDEIEITIRGTKVEAYKMRLDLLDNNRELNE